MWLLYNYLLYSDVYSSLIENVTFYIYFTLIVMDWFISNGESDWNYLNVFILIDRSFIRWNIFYKYNAEKIYIIYKLNCS